MSKTEAAGIAAPASSGHQDDPARPDAINEPDPGKNANESLAALVDHCTAALNIAHTRGDKFLTYMLEMTLQAAQRAGPGTRA